MRFELDEAILVLERTPLMLRSMLDGLTDAWVRSNYGPNTFSPFDVVGHLILGEKKDWIGRTKHILQHGESVAFEPFDRYAMYEADKGRSIDELLDEFATLREKNLAELKSMHLLPSQFNLPGLHPTLGRVTLGQLLATWVAHDLNHIHQIAKCMAIQYRDACGPWAKFLGVYQN